MTKLTKVEQEKVFKTPRMEGVKVSYANEAGEKVLTHTVIHSEPSVAVILRKEGKIALINQFRSTTGQDYWEIPAGLIKDEETEVEAAERETKEETGISVTNTYVLVKGPSLLDPSKSDENYGVAVADFYADGERNLDEMEQIDSNILWMEEEEVFARVKEQLFYGAPFYKDNFMSGHSLYAIMAYMMSK